MRERKRKERRDRRATTRPATVVRDVRPAIGFRRATNQKKNENNWSYAYNVVRDAFENYTSAERYDSAYCRVIRVIDELSGAYIYLNTYLKRRVPCEREFANGRGDISRERTCIVVAYGLRSANGSVVYTTENSASRPRQIQTNL